MSKQVEPQCPECKQTLQKVRYPSDSMLNREQFDAVRAGDWFCENHTNGRGNTAYAYYWDSELPSLSPEPAAPAPKAEDTAVELCQDCCEYPHDCTCGPLKRELLATKKRLEEAEFHLGRLREWRECVSQTIKTIPEFATGAWAGDKEGWGWHCEMVNYCRRQREAAEKDLAAYRVLSQSKESK